IPLFRSRIPPPPTSTLFPYTTLFRSVSVDHPGAQVVVARIRFFHKDHGPRRLRNHVDFRERSRVCIPYRQDSISGKAAHAISFRSEEHTSELQSLRHLVCRLLLEKKN